LRLVNTVLVCALGTGGTSCREGLYLTPSRTSANLRVSKSEEADNERNSGNICSKLATVTITTEVMILRCQLSRRVSRLASVGVLRPRSFVQPCTSEDLSDEAGLRQVMCVSGSSNSPSCLVRAAMIFATTRRFSTQLLSHNICRIADRCETGIVSMLP